MSGVLSEALQTAIYQRLAGDGAVAALVGDAIYDVVPTGALPEAYVTLGPEEVRDRSDSSGGGAEHRFVVSVLTGASGFVRGKQIAAAVGDALLNGGLTLSRGRLVGLWFERASARRTGRAGRIRRIDLRFRARVEDN